MPLTRRDWKALTYLDQANWEENGLSPKGRRGHLQGLRFFTPRPAPSGGNAKCLFPKAMYGVMLMRKIKQADALQKITGKFVDVEIPDEAEWLAKRKQPKRFMRTK